MDAQTSDTFYMQFTLYTLEVYSLQKGTVHIVVYRQYHEKWIYILYIFTRIYVITSHTYIIYIDTWMRT